jgi:serine/threonine-protein kinase
MDQKVVQKIGKYEIVAELGQGGMGVVYKARDPFIGRLVALKTITPELVSDPEILKRFYREAQSAGTLQHPNIVTIYDLGEAEGRPYIAMEFVEGESLQNIINRRARIPLAAKLKLVQQFCEGLGHAHKHGFVHRDVKPANILVTNDGNVKVVDFGIVHLETTNLTKTGMFLGTIHYASPEQINDGRVDNRSDLWSVTCVVYELIAYKKAFDGSNIAAIIAKVLSTEPEPLSRCCPGVPADLDGVISKGLKKNIDERYQSLDEMLGDLLPIARSLQQSFIGDLLNEAKELRDKGEFDSAQEKVRAVLILDNTHGEAKRLHSEISAEVHRLAPVIKAKRLVAEAEQVFSRGEYAEAVRILGEAQELNPADTQARNLKEKALREQDRLRELREALSSGQRAMNQGDLTGAEQELHRALQLDQNNPQAAELLEQIRQDRLSRERDFRLKEALWQADNLVSAGNFEEAQNRLLELQQDFPTSDAIQLKLQILDPFVRSRKLVQDGEHAFNQGEYAEAVRALTEALVLNPQDTEARDLKDRALQERDRLRQVREALSSGQRAMRQGDASAAEREFQKALQLDPTNTQATSLLGQIRQAQAAREREVRFREALQQSDNLVAERRFDDAQRALLELQQEFPDSAEIDQKLLELDQQLKLGRLLAEGQHAFDQGEFGEAVRILTEAQELDPSNERVRDLKVRAVQERDRLRQVREAISAGQRAMRQGDAGVAEREYQRALQLDPANAQATTLLAQLQKDRQAREREQRLQEGLSQAEKLLSGKKFDEAQRKLMKLQQAYPDAEEVQQKLQALSRRKAEAAAPPPLPATRAPAKVPMGGVPLSDAAKSMQYAEELRRSLQTPRPSEPAPPAKPPAPALTPTIPIGQAPVQATQMIEAPLAGPAPDAQGATLLLGSSLKEQARAEQMALEAPSPPPLPPPLPQPQVRVPPPTPAPPRVEPKKPAPAPAPPRVMPTPPAMAEKEEPKKSPMIMVAVIALVVILAIGGFVFLHHRPSAGGGGARSAEETQLETDAKGLQDKGDLQGALGKWQELAAKKGALKSEADSAVAEVTHEIQQQEKTFFDQAKAAQDAKKWDDAIAKYNKVADMNGTMKEQAQQAVLTVKQLQQGMDVSKIEQQKFQQATNALKKNDYLQARVLFQQVIDLKKPDSTWAPKAQAQLTDLDQILKEKTEFDAAERSENTGDLNGALAQFQSVANKPGHFQTQAKARIPKLNEMISSAAANAAIKQEFDAAVRAENNNDLNGALDKFSAIARKGGTFGSEAQKHIQQINDKLAATTAQKDWNAALQAENNNDLNGALAQFKAIAAKPGSYKDQAQTHFQQINDKLAAAADQQKFDDAVKKQNSGDLPGALAEFKALAGKPGAKQAEALDRFGQVSQLIANANKPKQPELKAPVSTPTTAQVTPTGGRNSVVTPLVAAAGDLSPLTLPYRKGMLVPDYNVDGGLQSTNLTMPPVQGAPPGSIVLIKIMIDENGNVTPNQIVNDTSGAGSDVEKAARAWKFKPPTAKGKPVKTSITVKVSF